MSDLSSPGRRAEVEAAEAFVDHLEAFVRAVVLDGTSLDVEDGIHYHDVRARLIEYISEGQQP